MLVPLSDCLVLNLNLFLLKMFLFFFALFLSDLFLASLYLPLKLFFQIYLGGRRGFIARA